MRRDERSDDKSKVKFRVIEFEVEGSNASIQESLRSISATLGRPRPGAATAARLAPVPAPAAASEDDAEHLVDDGSELDGQEAVEETPTARPPRARTARRVVTPEVLDLDIESGPMPLREFVNSKNPTTDPKRFLTIAYWFKEYRQTPIVTAAHIYTCYRLLDWSTPDDIGQPLRDLKNKRKVFNKGPADGEYEINLIGLNEVKRMNSKTSD